MNMKGLKHQRQHAGLNLIGVIALAAMLLVLVSTVAAPALAAPPKIVTISWVEFPRRYSYDGTLQEILPPGNIGPLDFLQTGKTYHVVSIAELYSIPVTDIKGSLVISGSGDMSGEITYIREDSPLLTLKDHITGMVTIDPDAGIMTGTYTQYRQAYGSQAEVLAAYPYAIPDKSPNARGWWFLDYTIYDVTEN